METTVFEAGFMGPQSWVLLIIAVILLFGAKKIPELMKGVGKGIKEFKDATNEDDEEKTPTKSN